VQPLHTLEIGCSLQIYHDHQYHDHQYHIVITTMIMPISHLLSKTLKSHDNIQLIVIVHNNKFKHY